VSPVRCDVGFHIPKDGILHVHRLENLKSYIANKSYGHVPQFRYLGNDVRDRN
jgi:hypothetical protein